MDEHFACFNWISLMVSRKNFISLLLACLVCKLCKEVYLMSFPGTLSCTLLPPASLLSLEQVKNSSSEPLYLLLPLLKMLHFPPQTTCLPFSPNFIQVTLWKSSTFITIYPITPVPSYSVTLPSFIVSF